MRENQLSICQKEKANALKGIAAVGVMLGHITPLEQLFSISGCLFVGLFLFYSGYGLMVSVEREPNYLHGFFHKKLVQIYLPFVIAETVHTILTAVFAGNAVSLKSPESIGRFLGIPLSNAILWYVWEILALYVVFACCHRLVKQKRIRVLIYGLSYILFCFLCVWKDVGNWWYLSTFAFLVGLFVKDQEKLVQKWLSKQWFQSVSILVFIGILIAYEIVMLKELTIAGISTGMIATACSMVAVPLFVIVTAVVFERFSLKQGVFSFLASVSYDIYLWHIVAWMCVCRLIPQNAVIQVVVTIIATLFISVPSKKLRVILNREWG